MAQPHRTLELTLRGRVLAWLALLAGGAAWLGDDGNARLAAAMLAAPLAVDLAARHRRLQRVEVAVAPRRTVAGAPFLETVTLTNRDGRAAHECLLFEPRTMHPGQAELLPALRPGVAVQAVLHARSVQRSHALERVFVLASLWPLGLFRSRAVLVAQAELVTEPARVPLSAEIVHAIAERDPLDRSREPGLEFHSLREHLPLEDARGVHALRSAAVGTLVRRIDHGRLPHTVGLVLDLRRPPGRALRLGHRHFEWSLGVAASLVGTLRRRAASVHVLVLDAAPLTVRVQSPADEASLLTALAEAQPTPARPLPEAILLSLAQHEHCFWIPAGGHAKAPEIATMPGTVTVVGEDAE